MASNARNGEGEAIPDYNPITVGDPIVWRLSLTTSPERVFEMLDTDKERERFWTMRSRATEDAFDLEFSRGLKGRVEIVERAAPRAWLFAISGRRPCSS